MYYYYILIVYHYMFNFNMTNIIFQFTNMVITVDVLKLDTLIHLSLSHLVGKI